MSDEQSKPRYTPENIRNLKEGEIFVFGSNTDGRHGKGAAKLAQQKFGAKHGKGEGLYGRSYALPTVEARLQKMSLERIEFFVKRFLKFAATKPELTFLVTQVGCGLAGYSAAQIAPFFKNYPSNCVLPESFHKYLS